MPNPTTPLKAVELFSGIGGFRLALDDLEIQTIWANDIKPAAIKVYTDNFGGDCLHTDDINHLLGCVPNHDVLVGGFPCQPFSNAGKKLGILEPRGTLFEAIASILAEKQPYVFILENVRGLLSRDQGQHFSTVINTLAEFGYTIEWRIVNASWFGLAQNRPRVILSGVRGGSKNISRLLTAVELEGAGQSPPTWISSCDVKKFHNWGICSHGECLSRQITQNPTWRTSSTLSQILEPNVSDLFDLTETTRPRLINSVAVNRIVDGVRILYNQKGGARMGYTVFGTDGLSPTLTASTSRHYERYSVGAKFRRLTPVEYARLQGFPDTHCQGVPLSTQYELYGNAIPPPMAKWAIAQTLSTGIALA